MTTIVNSPAPAPVQPSGDNSGGMGFVLGIIILVAFLAILFIYGLPMIKNATKATQGTTINVPDKIDVNVNQGK